jgi:radical SAM superfamily enzyme YgiQ (UPF0313 family)
MNKKFNVYFHEFNLLLGSGGLIYLPYVSGILAANAKKISKLKNNFNFQKFIFQPDLAENIKKNNYKDKPNIACFSISIWNEQLSLKIAKYLKEKYNCLIVFGGPSCPHNPTEYFEKNKFIDVAIRSEGEDAFNEILLNYLSGNESFSDIPNVAYRDKDTDKCVINTTKLSFNRNLDVYPSPYLTGEYDYIIDKSDDGHFHAIVETNRGCPFLCTYCYWGRGGSNTKYRFHSLERVFAEIEWFAKKKIEHIWNADSNFGMHRRDLDIAKKLIETKKATGYPDKFRTCWGKNTSEQIFKIANMLQSHDLEKGMTIARQSNSKEVLKNVKRDNIKLEAYTDLEQKFNDLKIPIYAEMILGLPGETYKSWVDGIGYLLDSYVNNQIFVYQAEVYPNTEMNEKQYREKYKIKTLLIELSETNSTPRDKEWTKEQLELVVGTYSFTKEDWKKMNLFSMIMMIMHSFKAGFYIMNYLKKEFGISGKDFLLHIIDNTTEKKYEFINNKILSRLTFLVENMSNGKGWALYDEKYSDVNLNIETLVYMEISENWDNFYSDMKLVVKDLIGDAKWEKNINVINEVFKYQDLRMPRINVKDKEETFEYNLPEYMFYFGDKKEVKLKKFKNKVKRVNTKDYSGNYWEYTKKKVLWSRKNDRIKNELDFDNAIINKLKEMEKIKVKQTKETKDLDLSYKPKIFDEVNKFEKFDTMDSV